MNLIIFFIKKTQFKNIINDDVVFVNHAASWAKGGKGQMGAYPSP